MSALVVDTSSWISYFKSLKNTEINEALIEARVHLPPLVLSELLSAKISATEQKKLIDFLSDLNEYKADFNHWVRVGELRREMSRIGIHLSTPDAHIAQTAIDLNAALLSEDKIFHLIKKHTKLKLV